MTDQAKSDGWSPREGTVYAYFPCAAVIIMDGEIAHADWSPSLSTAEVLRRCRDDVSLRRHELWAKEHALAALEKKCAESSPVNFETP